MTAARLSLLHFRTSSQKTLSTSVSLTTLLKVQQRVLTKSCASRLAAMQDGALPHPR